MHIPNKWKWSDTPRYLCGMRGREKKNATQILQWNLLSQMGRPLSSISAGILNLE